MIRFSRKNRTGSDRKTGHNIEAYILINIILAGLILFIFAYSGLYSPSRDNYPVICIHEKLTGQPCVSCGLSHSFSLIVRGRFAEAAEWNIYGIRIFLFFFSQILMRLVFSFFYIRRPGYRRELVIYDIAGSLIIFLVSFWPFIRFIFSQIH
jgi:hypothetical protein